MSRYTNPPSAVSIQQNHATGHNERNERALALAGRGMRFAFASGDADAIAKTTADSQAGPTVERHEAKEWERDDGAMGGANGPGNCRRQIEKIWRQAPRAGSRAGQNATRLTSAGRGAIFRRAGLGRLG
jgi:hypothetical protein